jgi:hypothetical protein
VEVTSLSEERDDLFFEYALESESSAEVTTEGKYRCRECGRVFDTLEAHDDHYRYAHGKQEAILSQGMAM